MSAKASVASDEALRAVAQIGMEARKEVRAVQCLQHQLTPGLPCSSWWGWSWS